MVNDFDLTNPDFFVSGNPHSLWKELRATDPVHWTERRDRSGFWSITTYADAQLVYRDPASFSSEGGVTLGANETSDPSEPQVCGHPKSMEELMKCVNSLDRDRKVSDSGAFIEFLSSRPDVKGKRFGAGYCMAKNAFLRLA